MITQDQLKDVLERADALHRYLEIDKKKIEYEEEDLRTQARNGLMAIRKYGRWLTNCSWPSISIRTRW